MKKLLVVVDYQNDFVSGSLGFPKAVELEKSICNKIKEYRQNNDTVIFTLDTHENDYMQTQEGQNLPVPHCIKNTDGIKLYGKVAELVLPDDIMMEKNTFGAKGLAKYFEQNSYDLVEFVGVVSNICVISNAVIAKAFLPEAEIVIESSCVASNDDTMNEKALDVMKGLQMKVL